MNVARALAAPHRTSIGQSPRVVFVPTVHIHETAPLGSDVLGVRPCAELAPLEYVTVIEQDVFGSVATVTAA